MSETHLCPDCRAQLPGETTLKAHKEATRLALEADARAQRTLEAATDAHAKSPPHMKSHTALALSLADRAASRAGKMANVARPCHAAASDTPRPRARR
jgi:hypothetical protein